MAANPAFSSLDKLGKTTLRRRYWPEEEVLNSRPFTIGLLTVLMMVALRVAIGWHFFQEGLSHKNDPKWSSEGFLRQAKGPVAEFYRSKAPGLHNFNLVLAVPLEPDDDGKAEAVAAADDGENQAEKGENEQPEQAVKPVRSPTYHDWYGAIVKDWQDRTGEIANRYGFTDDQKEKLDDVLEDYDKQLVVVFEGNKERRGYAGDIEAYRHQLFRNRQMGAAAGASDIPNLASRLNQRDANPTGEQASQIDSSPADWLADVSALEAALEQDALALRTEEQTKLGAPAERQTDLKKIDKIVTWTLIIGGACLVAGLFTRLSAVVLALFLASIIVSQPPWIAGAVPTYFQVVEFLALLVLATSHVGRWGGLDFFIHHILLRPFRSA